MFMARELNKNKTPHLNFIHTNDHAPSVVEWRCVTALTELYKLIFLTITSMKRNTTYSSTCSLQLVSFESTNP